MRLDSVGSPRMITYYTLTFACKGISCRDQATDKHLYMPHANQAKAKQEDISIVVIDHILMETIDIQLVTKLTIQEI